MYTFRLLDMEEGKSYHSWKGLRGDASRLRGRTEPGSMNESPLHQLDFLSLAPALLLSPLSLVEHRYPSGFTSLSVLHASFGQFLVGCRARVFERLVKVSWRFGRTRVFGGRDTIQDLEIPTRLPHWIYERFSKGFFISPHHAPAIYSVSVANQIF